MSTYLETQHADAVWQTERLLTELQGWLKKGVEHKYNLRTILDSDILTQGGYETVNQAYKDVEKRVTTLRARVDEVKERLDSLGEHKEVSKRRLEAHRLLLELENALQFVADVDDFMKDVDDRIATYAQLAQNEMKALSSDGECFVKAVDEVYEVIKQ